MFYRTLYRCEKCAVGLHPSNCFKIYHTLD
jgi:hypothetical protein